MGGEREDVIEGGADGAPIQNIRIHESGGQVHFHVDKSKPPLKVAVPVATWWEAWQRLKSPQDYTEFRYIDHDNKSVLTVATSPEETDDGPITINTTIYVAPFKGGDATYERLQRFSEHKS